MALKKVEQLVLKMIKITENINYIFQKRCFVMT